MPTVHERFIDALAAKGWIRLELRAIVAGSPNPSTLAIRRGHDVRRFLVYGWRITDEGKGRAKAGRTDRDFRIQTTRSDKGPLRVEAGYTSVGLGWDEEREVFAAFDVWTKRHTGWSSSVHMRRAMLDEAVAVGFAEEERDDGPEIAFRPVEVGRYLDWLVRVQQSRVALIAPVTLDLADADHASIVANPTANPRATWLRVGDHIAIGRDRHIDSAALWRIDSVDVIDLTPPGGNRRFNLRFGCTRHGVIVDRAAFVKEIR